MNYDIYEQLSQVFSTPTIEKDSNYIETESSMESFKNHLNMLVEKAHKLEIIDTEEIPINIIQKLFIEKPLQKHLELERKPWLKGKITIGFMGHLNVGKTTALNCLFDESFPISNNECTALGTYLSYGANDSQVRIVDKNGDFQIIPSEASKIFDYKESNGFPFARFFDYIQKENSSNILKNVSVLDTPGLFSSVDNHSHPTVNAIKLCDVVFWFDKLSGGFDNPTLDFIKNNITDQKVYFVFTYSDDRAFRRREDQIQEAINTSLENAKEKGIDVAGYFKFGKTEEIQKGFKESVFQEIAILSNSIEVSHPLVDVLLFVKKLSDMCSDKLEDLQNTKSEAESNKSRIETTFSQSVSSFVSAFGNMQNAFNSTLNTFQRRCGGATFCGGAANALCSDFNHHHNAISEVITKYNDIDFGSNAEIGFYYTSIALTDSKIAQVDELKKSLDIIISKFID